MTIQYHITHQAKDVHVLVLKGGWSVERSVSLVSGANVEQALRGRGYNVSSYDLSKDLPLFCNILKQTNPTVVFNALHGEGGEDGQIQGVLDMLGYAYTHSGQFASAVGMNKAVTKVLGEKEGISVPKSFLATWDQVKEKHPFKGSYVIKPNHEGSSYGVYIVKEGSDPIGAQVKEWPYGALMVEEYIEGLEVTCGVMAGQALPIIEISYPTSFLDFAAKYEEGIAQHIIPARIPQEIYNQAQEWALKAHNMLGCKGISRTDYRYDVKKNKLYFLEINTHPGFTPISLVPDAARHIGISFDDICAWLIEDALCHGKH